MKVERIWEAPRVTKPYTEEQWARDRELGPRRSMRSCWRGDVRLTMGGEPTFVSVDDPDGAEWNTAALGPNKRRLAIELFNRLKRSTRRRACRISARASGIRASSCRAGRSTASGAATASRSGSNPALFADETQDRGVDGRRGQRISRRRRRAARRARRSTCSPRTKTCSTTCGASAACRRTSIRSTRASKIRMERERLRSVFEQGLDNVVGHVLPIAREVDGERWRTGPLVPARERCYLMPGDSPMGYRLPLDSQPWVTKADYPVHVRAGSDGAAAPLPRARDIRRQLRASEEREPRSAGGSAAAQVAPQPIAEAGRDAVRRRVARSRARRMCARAARRRPVSLHAADRRGSRTISSWSRRSRPPREAMRDAGGARRLRAAERSAPEQLPRHARPGRDRSQHSSGRELGRTRRAHHASLRRGAPDAAHHREVHARRPPHRHRRRQSLRARRRDAGGLAVPAPPRPAAQPVAYWHNHPSLSYLFSGLFIGPTSQAPRVDEARNDSLYELELAFKQMPRTQGRASPPWLVDRLFRNLLIDATGNTHRAEFCIDKLFSPDGATGRLGLLELRAFEMPPHARMSLTQQLLLRALVARFWSEPYRARGLARWGTELHDRFMLPHFVEQRSARRARRTERRRLRAASRLVRAALRVPLSRSTATSRCTASEVELRQALEPWHVHGRGGRGRRHGALRRFVGRARAGEGHGPCAGSLRAHLQWTAVPLHPTGTVGEFVAGVRYRAWQPPSALHPTIGVHAPLTSTSWTPG